MSLSAFERLVQNKACVGEFSAQELWVKDDDKFRAYEVTETRCGFKLVEVRGSNKGDNLSWSIYESSHPGDSDVYIERLCDLYRQEGYTCFATQI